MRKRHSLYVEAESLSWCFLDAADNPARALVESHTLQLSPHLNVGILTRTYLRRGGL